MGAYVIAVLRLQPLSRLCAARSACLSKYTDALVAVLILDARHVLSSGLAGKAPNATVRPLIGVFSVCSMEFIMAPGMSRSLRRR